ncbi:hypothetical protein ACS6YU_07100 [Streptococcus suis]
MWRVRKKWIKIIDRVEANGGQITGCLTDARGFYGASFTDLDGIILMRL